MEEADLKKLEESARNRFSSYVKVITEGEKEAFPKVIFKLSVDGKEKTESLIGKYEKCGEAFSYYLPMRRVSSGVGSKTVIKGGVGVLYGNADALQHVEFTTMCTQGKDFDLEICETQNVNNVRSIRKKFTLTKCSFLSHPIKSGDSCYTLLFDFVKFDTENTKATDDGPPGGAKDVVSYNFDEGSTK